MRLPTQLSVRKVNSHKADFGHIFIIAGSARFCGAAVLCSKAALRAGTGLVTLGIPQCLNASAIKIKPLEVMTLPLPETKEGSLSSDGYKKIKNFAANCDVLVIGPGLGHEKVTQKLIRKVISNSTLPTVIDADGLNALVGYLNILRTKNCELRTKILTPHPGEMARLMGTTTEKIQAQRKKIATKFAEDYQLTLVLKGHRTIVADEAENFYINNTGNPGMATAGSGDVLTGMIAAFLGQGLKPFWAAKYAVYLHGLAGDLAAREKTQISLIASDIIDKIPEAIKKIS